MVLHWSTHNDVAETTDATADAGTLEVEALANAVGVLTTPTDALLLL